MRRLGLKDNHLEELPEAIGGLGALVELFITNNRVRRLPTAMAQLTSLVKLQVELFGTTAFQFQVSTTPSCFCVSADIAYKTSCKRFNTSATLSLAPPDAKPSARCLRQCCWHHHLSGL